MVQPIEFSLEELAAKTDPTALLDSNTSTNATHPISSSSPTVIEDNVTLSEEALAATRPSNLLTFASPNSAGQSVQASDIAVLSSESETQRLLNDGYSLSQIALEFNLPLATLQSSIGIQPFSTAA